MVQKNYYAIIPANVRYDKDLTPNAKLLYGEITALCNEKGYCWASNSYFSELYGVSIRSISKWVNQLIEKGYITSEMIFEDGKREVKERRLRIGVGIEEKFHTYGTKVHDAMEQKFSTPIEEKFQDNNTLINTTVNKEEDNPVRLFERNFGIMTPIQMNKVWEWVKDFKGNNEVVCLAVKETALKNPRTPFTYFERILSDWSRRKLYSTEQVLREKQKFEESRSNVVPINKREQPRLPREQKESAIAGFWGYDE